MKLLSLFSGIGGIDLAAQWAGIETVAFCEIDPYCQKVLRKHWPDVPIFSDVRELTAESLRAAGVESVDVVAGGFPCQGTSKANTTGEGLDDPRSGLWSEFRRIVGELRPRYVVVENVPALLKRGMGRVLGELASLGYDAEWDCVSAADYGAHQLRERIFVIASTEGERLERFRTAWEQVSSLHGGEAIPVRGGGGLDIWQIEPRLVRVVHGVHTQLDKARVCALGNAVVPQQVYPILKAIFDSAA